MENNLHYPIGKFKFDEEEAKNNIPSLIEELKQFPSNLEKIVNEIASEDHSLTYRAGGWNIRQLVHHLSDSHTNMLIRVKSALAKDGNKIMGYDEKVWAMMNDNELPLEVSLNMLKAIHSKVSCLFLHFDKNDFNKSYFHNGDKRNYTLLEVLALYAWHGKHHIAHIELALASKKAN